MQTVSQGLLLALILAGILGVAIQTNGTAPPTITISDAGAFIGKTVQMEGTLIHRRLFFSGHLSFELLAPPNRIPVICFHPEYALAQAAEEGKKIRVEGTIAREKNGLQLQCREVSPIE
ncbi:MAG: hypothetical protein HY917_00025 [Candidatus Diapherotrites archaeon]|nr:hypothetical protein [Candidatus Diapherotrites archaeon]